MGHAVMEHVFPGSVLVITMPEPEPVALVGELLAIQAQVRGAASFLIDAVVHDLDELRAMELPVWTRFVRMRGATKEKVGQIDVSVLAWGARIQPRDIVVLDEDGAVVVPRDRVANVLDAARARAEREARLRERLRAGELSFELHGLRSLIADRR